jgi:hypothetical protein
MARRNVVSRIFATAIAARPPAQGPFVSERLDLLYHVGVIETGEPSKLALVCDYRFVEVQGYRH